MEFWKGLSLRKRIILLVTLGMALILGVFAVVSMHALQESTERALNQRLLLAQITAAELDIILEHTLWQVQKSASLEPVEVGEGPPEAERRILRDAHQRLPVSPSLISLIDRKGTVVSAEPRLAQEIGRDLSGLPGVKQALETGRPSITDVISLPMLERPVVCFLSAVRNDKGEVTGLLQVTVDVTSPSITRVIQPVKLGQTGYAQIIYGAGGAVAGTGPEGLFKESDHADWFAPLIGNKRMAVDTRHGSKGQEMLAFAALSKMSWGVVIRQSGEEALAPTRKLQERLIMLGSISFLAVLFVALMTTQDVLRPIGTLTAASRRIAAGDLTQPVPFAGKDEIGVLARSFEMMRVKLKASLEEALQRNKELGESRDYLQAVIDSIDDELVVIGRDFRIRQVNAAFLKRHRLGQRPLGMHCYEVSHGTPHPCRRPECECPVARVLERGGTARVVHVHTNGNQGKRYVDIVASPLKDSQGNVNEVVELWRDITEEKRLEEQILKTNQDLLALNAIAGIISQSLSLEVTLASALERSLELVGGDVGGILLLEEETQTLSYAVHRGLSEGFVEGVRRLGLGEGIAGKVAQQREPIVLDDISRDARVTRAVVAKEGLHAFVSVPLLSTDKLMGVMNIASRSPRRFAPRDIDLLSAIGKQVGVAVEKARLYEELQRKEALRGELLRQIISTQEEERKRIARELHDVTGQELSTLAINLGAMATAPPSNAEEIRGKLEAAKSLALHSLDEVHKLIFDLRPSLLDDLGLIAAVRWYADRRLRPLGIEVHLETVGEERRLPSHIETALFRIVQEAIANIAQHAEAESASISLEFEQGAVAVHIEDDGRGFDVTETLSLEDGKRGLGLLGMKERVQLLGGGLKIDSRRGAGTELDIQIPL